MSLDDPAVLAGLAADGQPFFSAAPGTSVAHHDTDATPGARRAPHGMQLHLPPLPGASSTGTGTPAREADTRELRDFWKQYMRTPLTGPEGMAPTPGVSGAPGSRKRVASLPSAKTPVVERQTLYAPPAPPLAGAQQRTAVHAGEDLRSYEAAVMARKAPVTLNLQARRTQKARAQAPGAVSGFFDV